MKVENVIQSIVESFEGVHVAEAFGGTFFSCDDKGMYPFATIVTADDEYDSYSNLNRDAETYRLNISLDKGEFKEMFDVDGEFDFTLVDTLMPHPVYGKNAWISVVNPSEETFHGLMPMLESGHRRAVEKEAERKSRRED